MLYFAEEGGVEACVCGIGGDAGLVGANAVVEREGEVGFPVCVASHFDFFRELDMVHHKQVVCTFGNFLI